MPVSNAKLPGKKDIGLSMTTLTWDAINPLSDSERKRAAFGIGLLNGGAFAPNGSVSEGGLMDMLQRLDEMIRF